MVEGVDHRGGPIAQPQLREDVVDVRLHRPLADEELGGDLGVRLALPDEREHLALAAGQRIEARRLPAGAAAGAADR